MIRTFEVISANGETEFGYNLYTPEYGSDFVGNYPRFQDAIFAAVEFSDPGEVAIVDRHSYPLTRITIKEKA